jgi:signal transduction histidine kinase
MSTPSLGRRPVIAWDAVLAALACALDLTLFSYIGLSEERAPALAVIGYAVVGYAALLLRRRAPVLVFAALWVHSMVASLTPHLMYFPTVGLVVGIYTLADQRGNRAALWGLCLFTVPVGFNVADTVRGSEDPYRVAVMCAAGLLAYGAAGWATGRLVRVSRELWRASARESLGAERLRIARELHDVVAHSVTVMVLQAAGAQRVLTADPARGVRALGEIESAGKQTMTELRRMLRVLRGDDTVGRLDPYEPRPGLDDLEALVAGVRSVGVPARLRVEGAPGEVSVEVALTAYRVVQEALTNVIRYARPGAAATVDVAWAGETLRIRVTNEGPPVPRPASASLSSGYGLRGLRERVALAGGELRAGSTRDGGFEVTATLPVASPALPVPVGGAPDNRGALSNVD